MKLKDEVLNEHELMELLGITRSQLDYLRYERDFPTRSLGKRVRVYLAQQVMAYLKEGSSQAESETD